MPSLPLFPLGLTLMPGMRLPLQVFEPRYVALLHHLVDSQGAESGFGVLAIRHGYEVGDRVNELYPVGCLAVLDRIVQVADGLFLVLSHGERRFRLDGLDETAGTPWLTGRVTWLVDGTDGTDDDERLPALVTEVLRGVAALAEARGLDVTDAPDDLSLLAYWAAEAVDLERDDRQRLIEVDDTTARLALVRRMVTRETTLLTGLGVTGGTGPAPPSLN